MRWLLGVFLCVVAAAASAQVYSIAGYQQITSLSSSTALTVPSGATIALICAETSGVRWRDDGTAPTASVGMPLAAGQCQQYGIRLSAMLFIQQASGAILDVSYYR